LNDNGVDGAIGLDNAAQRALTAFCWWRPDLPRTVADAYWRDVHGVLAARVPGLWQYRQLRLGPNRADLWPAMSDLVYEAAEQEQPHGVPHASFRTERDQAAFAGNPIVTGHIFADEQNFLARGATQMSPPETARTLLDLLGDPQTQGPPRAPSFAVFFRARPDAGITDVHRYLTDHLAPAWAGRPGARRVRVVPLAPYDPAAWDSPGVDHSWPGPREYAGWVELALADEAAAEDLMAVLDAARFTTLIEAVHSYPISEVYTIVQGGRPTDVGLRGWPAVQTIAHAGAANQQEPELLRTLYGQAPFTPIGDT
jgi:hypothetical protein